MFFDESMILYGYNDGDAKFTLLNYYILTAKFHIFGQKLEKKKTPYFPSFLAFLKEKVLIHKASAIAN